MTWHPLLLYFLSFALCLTRTPSFWENWVQSSLLHRHRLLSFLQLAWCKLLFSEHSLCIHHWCISRYFPHAWCKLLHSWHDCAPISRMFVSYLYFFLITFFLLLLGWSSFLRKTLVSRHLCIVGLVMILCFGYIHRCSHLPSNSSIMGERRDICFRPLQPPPRLPQLTLPVDQNTHIIIVLSFIVWCCHRLLLHFHLAFHWHGVFKLSQQKLCTNSFMWCECEFIVISITYCWLVALTLIWYFRGGLSLSIWVVTRLDWLD